MTDLPINRDALADYLGRLHGSPITGLTLAPLGMDDPDREEQGKGFGYGKPIRLTYRAGGQEVRRVLHTTEPGPFGHEHMSDRAAGWLWCHHAFNDMPCHVPSHDVGAFREGGPIASLGDASEFFLLTGFAPGKPYADDVSRLGPMDQPEARDIKRCDALCDYLVEVHRQTRRDDNLYQRQTRQLVGHHECIFGLIDSYPDDDPLATPQRLQDIELAATRWRWRLKQKPERLRRVHGDFHPWNLLYDDDDQLAVLDRSRGEYGEAADDVTSITINYLFRALLDRGRFTGACRALYDRFWQRYLQGSGDADILAAAPPFLAFRGLVLASLVWYPDTARETREALLGMIERTLASESFDPDRIDELLELTE